LKTLFLPWLTALLAALFVLAACDDSGSDGDDDTSPTAESGTPDTVATTEDGRRPGGELTIASVEFGTLDPHSGVTVEDVTLQRMLYRGLYSLDADNQVIWEANGIASGPPSVSEDGRVYTVELNAGLRWSDGDDLTAEDYVAGVLRTCNPVVAGTNHYFLSTVVGCDELFEADPTTADLAALAAEVGARALDELTIEFTLNEPQPSFPIVLSQWPSFPVPIHLAQLAGGPEDPGEYGTDPAALAYNGPYALTDYAQQSSVTLVPNPNWSGAVSPTLDQITILFIDDLATANNAYRNDEVQVSVVDVTQLTGIQEEFGEEYLRVETAVTRALRMQLADPTLANFDVRLALSRALDRETLNEVVAQGAHQATTSWIPEVISGVPIGTYDDAIGFDPDAAREHLAAAGYPEGEGFPVLQLVTFDTPIGRALAEFLQQQYKEILNIDIELEIVDTPTFSSRQRSRDFQLSVGRGWTQDYPDLENWLIGIFETGATNNYTNCEDPDIQALIAEAKYNTDEEERRALYLETEELLITRLCGAAPYYHENKHYLIKPGLVGFRENSNSQDVFLPGDWRSEAWGYAE
jgi:oligopeptide transport system substrate-binding protein